MKRRDLTAGLAMLAASPLSAAAQSASEKAISLVNGYAPGGSTDVTARLLADKLPALLGGNARIVVENRPGAAGSTASDWLRKQPADGRTLMLVEASSHAILPHVLKDGTRYDPIEDFAHIAMVGLGPLALIVSPRFPAKTAQEALDVFRAAPRDSQSYASSGTGSITHLAAELLAVSLNRGGDFLHTVYRSGGFMVESIAKNQTPWGMAVLASAADQVRDERVRCLAVTSADRVASFPNVPTLAESGVPGFDVANWFAIVGPRGLPASSVSDLNQAVVKALTDPALQKGLLDAGVVPWAKANSPADTKAFFERENVKYREMAQRTGVRLDQ